MKSFTKISVAALILAGAVLLAVLLPKTRRKAAPTPATAEAKVVDHYFETMPGGTDVDWNELFEIEHRWREIPDSEYLFGAPDSADVVRWKALCEEGVGRDSVIRFELQVSYRDMNQWVAVHDLQKAMWWTDPREGDPFILWRIAQYDTLRRRPATLKECFGCLREAVDTLTDFVEAYQVQINNQAYFQADLEEFRVRLLLRELMDRSSVRLRKALVEEDAAWRRYRDEAQASYKVLDGNPNEEWLPWEMSIAGFREDGARLRQRSLEDCLFFVADGESPREMQARQWDKYVSKGYREFMASLVEDEDHFGVSRRKRALEEERVAWQQWMETRRRVSGLLSGGARAAWDNSTRAACRMKYIMLKNRYEGYGYTAHLVYDSLIPYDAPDEELDGPSFEQRLEAILQSEDYRTD